jgi:transcriptional regulator with XRE-family HTH domain
MSEERRRRGEGLAEALVRARKAAGLTQQELAATAGVDVDLIRKIERRAITEPGFFTVADLARAAGLDLGELGAKTVPSRQRARRVR